MRSRTTLLSVTLLRFLAVIAHGQTFYGSIVGTVTDASGALIPGARVTVTNLGTTEAHFKHFTHESITVEMR